MIVGLIGKKRSGKDTFAKTLVEERGFERRAFADPLKKAALHLNPIVGVGLSLPGEKHHAYGPNRLRDVVEALGWEDAKEIPEVRRTLQEYGVAIREIMPDFWIDATFLTMDRPGDYVITDVRFPNEVQAVKELGGVIVRIHHPGMASEDSHISETALDDYVPDLTVVNDGTLDDLSTIAQWILF